MTDIYSDELYSPSFAASSSHPQTGHVPVSPNNEMFAQRLQVANSQHLNAVHSPVVAVSRERSPFRHGPPLAPSPSHDFGSGMAAPGVHRHGRFNSAQQMREKRNAEQDARAMRQQMARGPDTANPQTISPKDAMLEFHDGDGDANADPNSHSDTNANFPQFPQASGETDPSFTAEEINKAVAAVVAVHEGHGYDGSGGMGLDTTGFGYAPGIQVPQQYPFVAQTSLAGRPPSMGQLRIGSAESGSSASGGTGLGRRVGVSASGSASGSSSASGSRSSPAMNSPRRPTAGLNADGGTYTCTYHGCTLRFETPALLQKHKREGHRQAHGLGARGRRADGSTGVAPSASAGTGAGPGSGSGSVGGSAGQTGGSGMTSSLLNTQAGPHRCDRINPSTGKPCNTIFSRPYDLTRHEDTIHNARKQKVRCNLCAEEKTFSRADALTRHHRVCHSEKLGLEGRN